MEKPEATVQEAQAQTNIEAWISLRVGNVYGYAFRQYSDSLQITRSTFSVGPTSSVPQSHHFMSWALLPAPTVIIWPGYWVSFCVWVHSTQVVNCSSVFAHHLGMASSVGPCMDMNSVQTWNRKLRHAKLHHAKLHLRTRWRCNSWRFQTMFLGCFASRCS